MKKNLQTLFIGLLLICFGANAQPVITAAGGIPVLGDKYLIQGTYSGAANAPTTSGANQVWDYSSMTDSSSAGTVNILSASGLPGASMFPTATIGWKDPIQGGYVFSNNKSNKTFGELGEYYSATSWGAFSPQLTRVAFPFTYGNIFADTAIYTGATVPAGIVVKVTDTLFADGFGTLKLPHNATYTNVLRIKVAFTLTYYASGFPLLSSTLYFYEFVQEGIHYPLLQLSANNNNGVEVWSAQYFAGYPVPLLISNFNSNWKNNLPNLQWNASNIANTKQFNIERSLDGKSFITIGTLSVVGNTAYQFTDNSYQSGTVYYRIQQLDKDGSVYYSDIAKLHSNENYGLKVWPNPSVDKVHLSLTIGSQYHVVVYDFAGKRVYENKYFTTNDAITTDKWGKGTYIVNVNTKEGWQTISFEKQ